MLCHVLAPEVRQFQDQQNQTQVLCLRPYTMDYILANLAAFLMVVIYMESETNGTHILNGQKLSDVDCSDGRKFVPNKYNCGQFYQCSYGIGILRSCAYGLYFNPLWDICDWPFNVNAIECSKVRQPYEEENQTVPEIVYIREVGKFSRNQSNSASLADCPEGTVPVNCACSSPGKCNGAVIGNLKCAVYSMQGTQQQAIVTCLSELTTAEFRLVKNGELTKNPVAVCPEGYEVFNCLLYNPWANLGYVFSKMDVELNQCGSEGKCEQGLGCQVQAICRQTKNN